MRPGETRDEMVKRLLHFHEQLPDILPDLSAFHEWNIEFALAKFRAKTDNGHPITFFNFQRPDGISSLETPWEGPDEKYAVMSTVRKACAHDPGVRFLSTITEVWIASNYTPTEEAKKTFAELRKKYREVRHMPGREDGLMVATYARDGGVLITRWVVKLKHNPANNRILARDDVSDIDAQHMYGPHFGYFEPEKDLPDDL